MKSEQTNLGSLSSGHGGRAQAVPRPAPGKTSGLTNLESGFESPDLTDLAFLSFKGFPAVPSARRGSLVFFSVNIPVDEAERLLASRERELIGRFQAEWRRLRRQIDVVLSEGGRR